MTESRQQDSGLPSHEAQQLYTASDVEHVVARRMAQIQIQQLEKRATLSETSMHEGFAQVTAKIDALAATMADQHRLLRESIERERKELRKEIDTEFALRSDLILAETKMAGKVEALETQLNSKIDKMWIKISAPLAAVYVLLQLMSWLIPLAVKVMA